MPACHRCGTAFEEHGLVSRGASCSSCGAALKTCHNCDFHDTRSTNECRELQAEPVVDKAAANFCELYRPNRRSPSATPAAAKDAKKPSEDAFAALFKK